MGRFRPYSSRLNGMRVIGHCRKPSFNCLSLLPQTGSNLESLHDDPEYQAMVAEIEADMATQLARVREIERNGELEPIPEIAAE
jgi:hypothetical protein